MLTKILITLLIIVGAVIFLRHKKSLNQQQLNSAAPRVITVEAEPDNITKSNLIEANIKLIAFAVLSLTLLTGTVMLFLNWQDDHRLYEIKIVNPQSGNTDIFQAYKKDLRGRSFTTITGQQIKVSELERLEFQEMEN